MKKMKKNNKYKVGDRVKFVSDQPSIYMSRYADGDSKIEKEEHVGEIKDICHIKGWYLYTIETIPVSWLCNVFEAYIKQ